MSSYSPIFQASNAFYYYTDLERAWTFYHEVMGFETAADFGFAKIMRVAQDSYLTLVDAAQGMHSVEEPKTVTLALVTAQVEGWFEYLSAVGVPMHKPYEQKDGRAHDGFVALDPEGYFLEIEHFNPHPENDILLPLLAEVEVMQATQGARPAELGVQGTVLWLYYRDLTAAQQFYESLLGAKLLVDQGWAKVYRVASSGYLGLVDGAHGLHQATEQKGVTVSFFTDDLEGWLARAAATGGFALRSSEIEEESGRVELFVGYDLEGYYLEWDRLLVVEENARLLGFLENGV